MWNQGKLEAGHHEPAALSDSRIIHGVKFVGCWKAGTVSLRAVHCSLLAMWKA